MNEIVRKKIKNISMMRRNLINSYVIVCLLKEENSCYLISIFIHELPITTQSVLFMFNFSKIIKTYWCSIFGKISMYDVI